MALNEDSRSLLQLMLARGKSYGAIAGLLGVDESEVRTRARSALTEIAGSDCDASLTDYLLGQADPIGRAETARALSEDPVARDEPACTIRGPEVPGCRREIQFRDQNGTCLPRDYYRQGRER